MNKDMADFLKKYGILSGIFIFAVLIIWGIFYLGSIFQETVFKTAAEKVLQNSPLCENYRNIKIKNMKPLYYKDLLFIPAALEAANGDTDYTVLFVRLTGKFGAYQGVFLYNEHSGTEFCGLAGNLDLSRSSEYYGITPAIIGFWCKKIDKVFEEKP